MICTACGFDESLKVTASWEITLPIKVESGNTIGSGGRGKSGWRYRQERKKYTAAFRVNKVKPSPAKKRRRIWLTRLWGKGQRAFDEDNLAWGLKPCCDELVSLHYLLNDTPADVERIYLQEKSPDKCNYLIIRIEDVEYA